MTSLILARQRLAEHKRLTADLAARKAELARLYAIDKAWCDYFNDRTDFVRHPEHLAHIFPLLRNHGDYARTRIGFAYDRLFHRLEESIPAMAGMPTIPPLKVDLHKLPPAARPYLVTYFIGLTVGRLYPRLCLDRSVPGQSLTYIVTGGPADPEAFRPHLDKISAWLGGHWVVAHYDATTVTLQYRPELPAQIPFNPAAWLKPGHLFLGLDVTTHQPFHVPLSSMTHTLVAGTSGMGKSVFLHVLMKSCLHSIHQFHRIYAVCGQGVAFERYRGVHPKLTVNNDAAHLYQLATDLQDVMKQRAAHLVAHRLDKMADYILVLIDEWGAFNQPEGADKDAKEAHKQFMQNMMHLGKRGRTVGIRLMFVIQEPVERDLSPGIRSVLTSTLAFRIPVKNHAMELFGEITPPAVPADPRTLPIGRAIFHDGARSTRTLLQIPVTEPPRYRS